jgi:NitT/TauT family transport system permease protein
VSFFELFCGYGLACTAIPLGIILGRSQTLEYIFDPLISALNAIPRVAMMPLIILMLGIGINSKIFLIFFGCFFPILVNVFQGTKHIDPLTIDMAKVFGAKGWKLFREVLFPSILPYLVAGFRIALAVGLIMVVVAEFFVGSRGIGYAIAYAGAHYNADELMAWVFIIASIAIFFTELIKYSEGKMRQRWYGQG